MGSRQTKFLAGGYAAVKNKVYDSVDSVVADVPDGATIMFGGFGGTGFPNGLIRALASKGHEEHSCHQQQLRHRRIRVGPAVQESPDQAHGRELSRSPSLFTSRNSGPRAR